MVEIIIMPDGEQDTRNGRVMPKYVRIEPLDTTWVPVITPDIQEATAFMPFTDDLAYFLGKAREIFGKKGYHFCTITVDERIFGVPFKGVWKDIPMETDPTKV